MLYPLSYEGGRWRKGGAKPPAAITASQATGRIGAPRRCRAGVNRTRGGRFDVPEGVCAVTVDAVVAQGGSGTVGGAGGLGGSASATIPVSAWDQELSPVVARR
jgi:hypothetical protein